MNRVAPAGPSRRAGRGLDGLERLIVVGALLKIAAGLVLVVSSPPFVLTGFSNLVRLAHVVAFGAAAVFLTTSGARDRRAFHLGGFFLLVAVSFANGLIRGVDPLPGAGAQVRHTLLAFHPDAFLPFFLWQFVRHFPRLFRFDSGQGLERAFVRVAVAVGLVCCLATAFVAFVPPPASAMLEPFAWGGSDSWFDAMIFGLALPALPFGLWKARRADVRERRRYRLFVAALAVGFLPIAAQVLAEASSPAFNALMSVPPRRALLGYVVLYPLLLSIPVTTTYAVVVHRVMDVKVLVRTALQYALARVTIVALAAVPAVILVASIVRNRNLTVGDLFAASNAWSVLLPLGLLLVALTTRRLLLDVIDRWFFREAVDARALLAALATSTVGSQDTLEALCQAFSERVQATFHLAQADVLVADRAGTALSSVGHRLRPLPLDSTLASALAGRRDPLVIELDQPGQWVQDLPLGEQQWLADADVHLLVPLVSGNGFVGAMALGEKLNGLPFSHDDQSLLAPAGAALALQIELLSQRTAPAGTPPLPPETREPREAEEPALVCAACSFVSGTDRGRCDRCGGAVTPGRLPALLAGKFRLERELGRGGMGVVYVAFDTALERRVAIKTLPQVAVAESVRLRREARAMAGFTHPNLALIFGIESWRGVPALVMEFLEGGTLANRLNRGPLTPGEVELLAHELAGAIALIHDAGMLHRDIKPSNIAYTSTGQPKLLDFGLAQIIVAATPREFAAGTAQAAASWLAGSDLTTVDRIGNFAGTPAYMAPEATRGEALDGASDLWSFGLVLFECATGERPRTATAHAAVTRDWATELLARAPQCPPHLRELIADLLAADKDHRPPSAQSVRARLREHATLRVA